MSSPKKSTIKLPRLRTKDELLKTSPELFNKLLLGDDMSSARSTIPQTSKTQHAAQATAGRLLSRPASHKAGQLAANYDTPRGFGDEPLTIDQELAIELESVKRERQQLLESIAQVKAESGTAGGEAQQADIRQLLKELELKKAKLNELKGDSRKTEAAIAKMRDDDTDAQRLTPGDCVEENAYIQGLRDEMARVEEDLLEADAKNRLYYLLGERTRREHMAIDQKVQDKQESKHACLEDLANLNEHYNATRAAKELAEKELAKTKRQVEEARADWMRKIRERRAEVRELKKRQQKEREKEVKRREKQLEKEKAERVAQAKLKMEQEAYNLQVAALAPKIEAMEASWNRLRAISGAETPNEVVEYWQGLKAKEQHMHELVSLAEKREAACKSEISQLLASRSAMFESSKAAAAVAAAASAAAAAAVEAAHAAGTGVQTSDKDLEAVNAQIEAAEKRMDAAQVQFNKLRSICVAAEQGLRSLLHRLQLALEEVPPAGTTLVPSPHISHHLGTTPGQAGPASGAGQVGAAGSRLQSAGASSNAGSHVEGMRRSAGGAAGNRQGRTTKDALDSALASKTRLNSSARTRDARSAGAAADFSAANLALVPEDVSSASLAAGNGNGSLSGPMATLPLAGLAPSGPASAAVTSRPNLPSRGKDTIEDDNFFEVLPQVLADVTEKLEKLLAMGEGLDYAALRAAAVMAAEGSMLAVGSPLSTAPNTARMQFGAAAVAAAAKAAAEAAAKSQEQQKAGEQTDNGGAAAAAATDAEAAQGSEGTEAAAAAVEGDSAAVEGGSAAAAAEEQEEDAEGAGEVSAAATAEHQEGDNAEDAQGVDPGDDGASQDAAAEDGSATTEGGDPTEESLAGDRSGSGEDGAAGEAAAAAEGSKDNASGSADQSRVDEPKPDSAAADTQQQQPPTAAPAAAAARHSSAARSRPASGIGAVAAATPAAVTIAASTSSTMNLSSTVPATALAVGGAVHSAVPDSEKALLKGLPRRTWTGAPWMDSVGDNALDMTMAASMKRKKGKKKEAAPAPDLSRIMGYTPPNDVPAESDSSDDDDAADAEGGPGADGVVDREYIKMRAAKMMARHNAKQAAAAAAAQQGGR